MGTSLHASLAAGRWFELSLLEQLANVGSEVGRAARATSEDNEQWRAAALDRALELFDLTLADGRWRDRRKEIARAREVVCDFLVGDNEYGSTAQSLDRYFLPFAVAARRDRQANRRQTRCVQDGARTRCRSGERKGSRRRQRESISTPAPPSRIRSLRSGAGRPRRGQGHGPALPWSRASSPTPAEIAFLGFGPVAAAFLLTPSSPRAYPAASRTMRRSTRAVADRR
jgi:hypothetical protein